MAKGIAGWFQSIGQGIAKVAPVLTATGAILGSTAQDIARAQVATTQAQRDAEQRLAAISSGTGAYGGVSIGSGSIDGKTLMLFGAGALVLILLLRKG